MFKMLPLSYDLINNIKFIERLSKSNLTTRDRTPRAVSGPAQSPHKAPSRALNYEHQNLESVCFLGPKILFVIELALIAWRTDNFTTPTNINNKVKLSLFDHFLLYKSYYIGHKTTKIIR